MSWDFSLFPIPGKSFHRTYVNLWEGDIVLSEDCLPGKEGSLLLMFSTTDFLHLSAPRAAYENQELKGTTDVFSSRVDNRRSPRRET